MAGNNRQRQLAFQAASSALRDAETWLITNITNVTQFETTFNGTPVELYWVRQPTPGDTIRDVPMDIYDGYAWTVGNSQQPALWRALISRVLAGVRRFTTLAEAAQKVVALAGGQ